MPAKGAPAIVQTCPFLCCGRAPQFFLDVLPIFLAVPAETPAETVPEAKTRPPVEDILRSTTSGTLPNPLPLPALFFHKLPKLHNG